MTPEQIFALIAALTAEPDPNAFATLKAGGADPAYPVTVTPCARPVAPTEIDGRTIICGTVAVPFDHHAPDSPKINIAFNLYKSRSLIAAGGAHAIWFCGDPNRKGPSQAYRDGNAIGTLGAASVSWADPREVGNLCPRGSAFDQPDAG